MIDEFKQEISLQEAVTNKMIMADPMSNRIPKRISLYETFKNLFPKKDETIVQSADEITKRMRQLMKFDKK